MSCCVCNGSCCHTGPCSYCTAHGGQVHGLANTASTQYQYTYTPYTTYTYTPYIPQYIPCYYGGCFHAAPPKECDHCYCTDAPKHSWPNEDTPHVKCCKCSDKHAVKFFDEG